MKYLKLLKAIPDYINQQKVLIKKGLDAGVIADIGELGIFATNQSEELLRMMVTKAEHLPQELIDANDGSADLATEIKLRESQRRLNCLSLDIKILSLLNLIGDLRIDYWGLLFHHLIF